MATIALKGVHPNMIAFLLLIQHSEGTDKYPNPYQVGFGGYIFTSFKDHPRKAVYVPSIRQYTSAAGAYQFMAVTSKTRLNTWDIVKEKLNLPDFSPENQDRAAIERIKFRGGYEAVINGDIKEAISKCSKEWASLPGANYPGQSMRSLSSLLAFYAKVIPVGGVLLSAAELTNLVKKKEL